MELINMPDLFLIEKVFEKMGLPFCSLPCIRREDTKEVIILAVELEQRKGAIAKEKTVFFIFDMLGKFLNLYDTLD